MTREQKPEQNLISLIQSIREETQWFRNYYCCDHEGTEHEVEAGDGTCWEDEWSCMCNDRCPVCNHETQPYKSEELE